MSSEPSVRRNPGVVARAIAGETILVPVTRHAQEMGLFTLDEVGTFVWQRLDGRSLDVLADDVAGAYDVDPPTARADLERFVALLLHAGCAAEVAP